MCGTPGIQSLLEYKGIFWQEEIIPFFQQVILDKGTSDVCELFLELADKVRKGLGHLDPYFNKLADGMIAWIAG